MAKKRFAATDGRGSQRYGRDAAGKDADTMTGEAAAGAGRRSDRRRAADAQRRARRRKKLGKRLALVAALACALVTAAVALAFAEPGADDARGGENETRSGARAANSPRELRLLCVRKGDGLLRHAAGPGRCADNQRSLRLPEDAPVRACVLKRGNFVFLAPRSGKCGLVKRPITIPDARRTLRFCASNVFPWLRYSGDGRCDRGQTPMFVPPGSRPDDRPPTARNLSVRTNEDAAKRLRLPASDPDRGRLTYTIVRPPAHGRLSGAGASRVYTPAPNYNGSDSFAFRVSDGRARSRAATVSIRVVPVNDPPRANDDAAATGEDVRERIDVLGNDTDVDGGALAVGSFTQPAHGTVSRNPDGTLGYDPAPNYNGPDSFGYTADDGRGGTDTARVGITVRPVNDAPSFTRGPDQSVDEDAGAQSVSGWATNISKGPADESGQNLTFEVTDKSNAALFSAQPAVSPDGTLTYTPEADAAGDATIKVFLKDDGGTANGGDDTSDEETFEISVGPINDAPEVSVTNNGPINEGSSATITATATDEEGDTLSYTFDCNGDGDYDDPGDKGPQPGNSADCLYEDNGQKTAGVRVADGNGGEGTGSTTVEVNNVAPTGTLRNTGPINEGGSVQVSFEDIDGRSTIRDPSDVDTNTDFKYEYQCDGSFAGDPAPNYATASQDANGSCTFRQDGTKTVAARVLDKDNGATEYTTNVTVNNVAPSVTAAAAQTSNEGQDKPLDLGSFTDPGDDGPWQVTVDWGDGSQDTTFTADADGSLGTRNHAYADNDSDPTDPDNDPYKVTVTVAEAGSGSPPSDSATFDVTVENVAPSVTLDGPATADEGETKTYAYTVTDPGDDPGPTIVEDCGSGVKEPETSPATPNSFDCTFPDGPTTTDVTVRATDEDGATDTDDRRVTVNVANVAPTVTLDGPAAADEGETETYTYTVTDPGDDPGPTITESCGDNATLVDTLADDSFDCVFANGPGTSEVKVTADDGADTGSGAKTVDVNNVAPAAEDQSVTSNEDEAKTITLTGSDVAADSLTFRITSLSANGKLYEGEGTSGTEIAADALPYELNGDKVTYKPNEAFTGDDGFQFTACDDANPAACDADGASIAIKVNALVPAQLALTTQPSESARAGAAFDRQPVVQLQTANGTSVKRAGFEVTAAIASGGGTLGGTATATTDASGRATFTNLSIGGTVGNRTLSFSANGLTGATSSTIEVTPGTATALAFSQQPSDVVASASITPAVRVEIRDEFGNRVTNVTDDVTLAIGNNPSGGTLSGTTSTAAVDGAATFSNLSINLVGTGYTLAASSGTLTGATSAGFNVTHGPLDHFLVEAAGGGPIVNQLAGTPFNVRVTAQDAYNNTVTSFTGTVGFTSTPSGGISAGGTSGAFTAGVLSSHGITFGTPGSFTLTATRTGGTESGTSNSFEVQAPPTAVNDGPTSNSSPGQLYHAFYSTSGSPQTFNLSAPGVLSNDNLGFPVAEITSFGADDLGGTVTTYSAGSTVSPLPGPGVTTGSLRVDRNGSIEFTPPDGFTGEYKFRYRLTNVRGTSDGQVTIAVGDRPSAVDDTYSPRLVGNVPINTDTSTNFKVNANDRGDASQLAIVGQSNGTAALNADSTFTFRPNAGYEGAASFSYTVTNGFGTSAPATVSMTVADPIWFINGGAGAGGDGRYDAPSNSLASFASINNGTGSNPAANDRIFLYSGTYTGNVTLLNGQRLIGQGATASLSSIAGVTWPADAGPEPAMNETAPTIGAGGTNAVTLNGSNGSNLLRGFDFGNVGAAGTALSGASFGTLTASEVGINTNGRALDLGNGTLSGSGFTQLRSTGGTNNVSLTNVGTSGTPALGTSSDALSGAASDAFKIDGGSGSLSYSGTISATSGRHVSVANRGTGTVSFDGAISGTGTGVSLDNNDNATVNFTGGLTLSTGTSGAFTATNGGTVNVTGTNNTLTTGTGTALKVENTGIGSNGLTFKSISANGATNGIVLNSTGTSGGLTVAGNGGSCTIATPTCTGGTIQNTTGDGVSLTNTSNPSFGHMQVKDTAGHGISGTTTSGLNLSNSLVRGAGDADNEAGLYFATTNGTNLTGNSSITNTVVHAPADVGAFIQNYGGTLNLTVSGSTFSGTQKNTPGVVTGDDLLRMIADRTNSGSATITVSVTGSTFRDSESDDILANAQSSVSATDTQGGTMNLTVDDNTFDGNGVFETCETQGCNSYAIVTQGTQGSTIRYTIQNNDIINHLDAGVAARSDNNSNVQGVIQNNTIGAAGSPRSGSYRDRGIYLVSDDSSDFIARVENNTIHSTFFEGISASTTDGTGLSPKMDLTILGNSTPTPADTGGTYLPSIGMNVSGNASACARTENNTAQAGRSGAGSIDFLLFRDTATSAATFKLEGLSSPTADASSYVDGKNPASADPVYAFAAKDGSNSSTPTFTGGTCRTPAPTPTP